MAFHFKKKESPTKAARRLSRERLDKALAHLRKCDRLEAVHSVRKEIKKVRAALGLVGERMDGRVFRKYSKTLRAAARQLRDPRDAHVRLRTLERLVARFKGRLLTHPFPGIKKFLRQNCLNQTREFLKGKAPSSVDRMLRKINRRAADLKVKTDGWAAIQPGLKQSYQCGREALAAARRETSPENLHEWRKQVQNLWHQLRLLCPVRPDTLRVAVGDLKTLSQQLGDDHDLVMLSQFAASRCTRKYPVEVKLLNELIERRQRELRAAAFSLGSRFYAEKPAAFCQRLENYWHAWRANKKSRS